jgi:hypothetical protein
LTTMTLDITPGCSQAFESILFVEHLHLFAGD